MSGQRANKKSHPIRENLSLKISLVIVLICLIFVQQSPAETVNVNLNTTYQTIRGFGGMNFPRWIGTLTNAQVDTAFGNGSNQIGFTIMRCDVPPSTSSWSGEISAAQRAINNHGAIVFASPWSPPASMKTNGNLYGGSLKTDSYGAYATHLSNFANYMSSNSAPLYAISLQNEADFLPDPPGYESCLWTPSEMRTFLDSNASVIPVKVIAPETVHPKSDWYSALSSASELDIYADHLYGGTPTTFEKEHWMTEHLDTDTSWTAVLATGKEIHDCMVNNYSAYIWWYIRRSYGPIDESGNITQRGYVMSHFAKFIRPGYVRVNATETPDAGVSVTAYKNDANLVIVAINQNSSSSDVTFSINGFHPPQIWLTNEMYRTTSASNWASLGGFDPCQPLTLPAESITTIHIVSAILQTCADVQSYGLYLNSDLNSDCYIDYNDLKIIADNWLRNDCDDTNYWCDWADWPSMDGSVDFTDLSDFASQWMQCNNPQDPKCIHY